MARKRSAPFIIPMFCQFGTNNYFKPIFPGVLFPIGIKIPHTVCTESRHQTALQLGHV